MSELEQLITDYVNKKRELKILTAALTKYYQNHCYMDRESARMEVDIDNLVHEIGRLWLEIENIVKYI